jgi:putative ABC transport system permease protein
VFGRLKPDRGMDAAQREVDDALAFLDRQYPGQYRSPSGELREVPLLPMLEAEVGQVRSPLLMLLGAVGLMLLIACANVANLFLARGADRERELAVRAALGAGRTRLASQLLTESVLIAVLGGALGVALTVAGIRLVAAFGPADIPRLTAVSVDYRVLAFAVVAAMATGVVFGLAPAYYAARTDVGRAVREGGNRASATRGHLRLKSALVVTEIALALVLLVGAGLLFNSFVRLTRVDPGFVSENVLAMPLSVERGYDSTQQRVQFARSVLDRVEGIAGVQRAAVGLIAPFSMGGRCCWMTRARPVSEMDSVRVVIQPVGPGYFETLGMTLVQGRALTWADDDTEPVNTVITRTMANAFFGEENPVGELLSVGRAGTSYRIAGVVEDPKFWSLSDDEDYDIFVPFAAFGGELPFFTVAVRGVGDQEKLSEQLRAAVWSIDPSMPVPEIKVLATEVRESIAGPRFMSGLLVAFAVLAIALAAGGIYGTMLYSVSQRSRELGIRLALGARSGQLLRHVLGSGATLTGAGLVIGLGGAYALSRILAGMVFGISVQDAPTYFAVTLLLAAVALAACYVPARKAAGLDPIVTLRME